MPSPLTCQRADLPECIVAQQEVIERFEFALWNGGFNHEVLASYQSAWRALEALIAKCGADDRHAFVIVIPVADSPVHLRSCLASLLELCRTFGYGGMHNGRYQKVAAFIADDSHDASNIAAHRAIAREFDQLGVATTYFGLEEQVALVESFPDVASLSRIIGDASADAFSHKGQAIMRNLAQLKLAQWYDDGKPILFYTIDADQSFKINIPASNGSRNVCALNFFAQLDAIFSTTDVMLLTGKVVGDPPVSPAVMAGHFLEDVVGFLREMHECDPNAPYRQPPARTDRSGDATYHDMADLFGFPLATHEYRYRCTLSGEPTNIGCFADFSGRLNRFFHGEHPTRFTWYRPENERYSVTPARTVYTGNTVFRPGALNWFIPFASLRLRMSGPVMGRLLRAAHGPRFVSANLPMLHTRTVETTGQAEFRPGVVLESERVDLHDEFERQFYGDVMLFSVERLIELGFPEQNVPSDTVAETLDSVQAEMRHKYLGQRQLILKKLVELTALFRSTDAWWRHGPELAGARAQFDTFIDNIGHNFGEGTIYAACVDSAHYRRRWRTRQLEAINCYPEDQRAWDQMLATVRQIPVQTCPPR
jgi:hypothetical protein